MLGFLTKAGYWTMSRCIKKIRKNSLYTKQVDFYGLLIRYRYIYRLSNLFFFFAGTCALRRRKQTHGKKQRIVWKNFRLEKKINLAIENPFTSRMGPARKVENLTILKGKSLLVFSPNRNGEMPLAVISFEQRVRDKIAYRSTLRIHGVADFIERNYRTLQRWTTNILLNFVRDRE